MDFHENNNKKILQTLKVIDERQPKCVFCSAGCPLHNSRRLPLHQSLCEGLAPDERAYLPALSRRQGRKVARCLAEYLDSVKFSASGSDLQTSEATLPSC